MLNCNDQFGTNSLIQNAVDGVLSIVLNGSEPEKPSKTAYTKIQLILDLIYLLLLVPAFLTLILSCRTKKLRKRDFVLMPLGYLIYPLFLLYAAEIFVRTPLWTVKSYVPDLFFVIILGVCLSVAGGIVRAVKACIKK